MNVAEMKILQWMCGVTKLDNMILRYGRMTDAAKLIEISKKDSRKKTTIVW